MWRKITRSWILCLVIFCLAGCSGAAEQYSQEWQNQYDLGMRYLSEENYEEAIVALKAAIQIEPKAAAGYVALAEAYMESDKLEEAIRVLKEAPEDVDNQKAIQEFLGEIEKDGSDQKTQNTYAPSNSSYYREFSSLSENMQELINQMAEALMDENMESIFQMGRESLPKTAEISTSDSGNADWTLCTYWNEYKLYIDVSDHKINDTDSRRWIFHVELRPREGTGYAGYVTLDTGADGNRHYYIERYAKGACLNWLWEGNAELQGYSQELSDTGELIRENMLQSNGTMHEGFRDGEFITYEKQGLFASETTDEYEEGRLIHRVRISEDGDIYENWPDDDGKAKSMLFYAGGSPNTLYW